MISTLDIKVTIPELQLHMRHLLAARSDLLQTSLEEALSKAVADGTFDAIVTSEATRAVSEAIKMEIQDYFRFGGGRMQVRDAARKALDEIFDKPKASNEVE